MKSCKIFTSAMMLSMLATSAVACQRCNGGSCRRPAPRPAQAQPQACANGSCKRAVAVARPVAQATIIGNGSRVFSIHNSGLPIYFKAIVDNNTPATAWSKTTNAMPVIIRFNNELTITLALDDKGTGSKTFNILATDLPGKTFLLTVLNLNSKLITAPDILPEKIQGSKMMPAIYANYGIKATCATNVTAEEITGLLNQTITRIAEKLATIKVPEAAATETGAAETTTEEAAPATETNAEETHTETTTEEAAPATETDAEETHTETTTEEAAPAPAAQPAPAENLVPVEPGTDPLRADLLAARRVAEDLAENW